MKMIRSVTPLLLWILAICGVAQPAPAQDWPQWRGPSRDGVVTGFIPPAAWPDQLQTKWKVAVGIGHSSPVVAGQQVFVHSRQDENEVVSAFDLDTGKLLWSDRYPVAYTMNEAAVGHGKGPKSTPAVSNGRLYTFGITGILSCYDTSTGKLRWRKDFSRQFNNALPLYGTAASPVVDGKLLIVHVGGNDKGALTAFDADTGAVKWSWPGDGPGYASPVITEFAGVRQVVALTQQNIIGVAAADGKLLWQMPYTTEYVMNIVTPVRYDDLLIFSGYKNPALALRVTQQAGAWKAEQAWSTQEVSMFMSSPVLSGDVLVGMSMMKKGQFFCLDARNGKTLWLGDPRQGDNAAALVAGDLALFLTSDAELHIERITAQGLVPVKRYTVAASPTWAHPVLAGRRILVKDVSNLSLLSLDH